MHVKAAIAGITYTAILALASLTVGLQPIPSQLKIPLLAVMLIVFVHGVLEPLYFLARHPLDRAMGERLAALGMPCDVVVSRGAGAYSGQAVGFLPHLKVVVISSRAAQLLGGHITVLLAHEGAHIRLRHGLRYILLVSLILLLTPLYMGSVEALLGWLAIVTAALIYVTRRFEGEANRAAREVGGEEGYLQARALLRREYAGRGRLFRFWYRLTHPED